MSTDQDISLVTRLCAHKKCTNEFRVMKSDERESCSVYCEKILKDSPKARRQKSAPKTTLELAIEKHAVSKPPVKAPKIISNGANMVISDDPKWLELKSKISDKYLSDDCDLLCFGVFPDNRSSRWSGKKIQLIYLDKNDRLSRIESSFQNNQHYRIEIPLNTVWISKRGMFDECN